MNHLDVAIILAWALAAEFVIAGAVKLLWRQRTRIDSKRWGYSVESLYAVAVFEIVMAGLLLHPATDLWAALALVALMLGALWTTIFHGKWWELFHPTITIAALFVLVVFVR